MTDLTLSYIEWLFGLLSDRSSRLYAQRMVEKHHLAHIEKLKNSANPEDVFIDLTHISTNSSQAATPSTPSSFPTPQFAPRVVNKALRYSQQIGAAESIWYSVEELLQAAAEDDDLISNPKSAEKDSSPNAATAWAGYGAKAPLEFPVHPDEMAGEGCYRMSNDLSDEEVLRICKERMNSYTPLIAVFVGEQTVRGMDITYDELSRNISNTFSSFANLKLKEIDYEEKVTQDGCTIQRGFPFKSTPTHAPLHRRTEWYAQDPTAREENFCHMRFHSGYPVDPDFAVSQALRRQDQEYSSKRMRSKIALANCNQERASGRVQVRFDNNPQIHEINDTLHPANVEDRGQKPESANSSPCTVINAGPETEDDLWRTTQDKQYASTTFGTALPQTHNTPSLSSKEHPLFARSLRRPQHALITAAPHPSKLVVVPEENEEEESDHDSGPWVDIMVERSTDADVIDANPENVKPNAVAKPRAVRPILTRKISDKRPLARQKSQHNIPTQSDVMSQPLVPKEKVVRAERAARARGVLAQQQACAQVQSRAQVPALQQRAPQPLQAFQHPAARARKLMIRIPGPDELATSGAMESCS